VAAELRSHDGATADGADGAPADGAAPAADGDAEATAASEPAPEDTAGTGL
jgi:hypothetical protein